MRKFIYVGVVLVAASIVGLTAYNNSTPSGDQDLIELAKEVAMQGEVTPMFNIKVHLTIDREYAIVDYTQAGQEYMTVVQFDELELVL
jgi:hypothetical protein